MTCLFSTFSAIALLLAIAPTAGAQQVTGTPGVHQPKKSMLDGNYKTPPVKRV